MKTHYKCDSKLRIYDHAHTRFYERNLKRAKKLYVKDDGNVKRKDKMMMRNVTWSWKEDDGDEKERYSKEEFEVRKRKVRNVFAEYFRKDVEEFEFEELMEVVKGVKEGKKCWLRNDDNERDYDMRLKGEEPVMVGDNKDNEDENEYDEEEEESDNEYTEYTEYTGYNDDNNNPPEINAFKPVRTLHILKHNNTNKDNYDIEQITYNHNLLNSKYEQIYNINDSSNNNNTSNINNTHTHTHNDDNDPTHKSFSVSETDINHINRILFPEKTINYSSSFLTLNTNINNTNYHIVKIQMKYRKHKRKTSQPAWETKIYSGWNSKSTHSIFLYIYNKDNHNNVISLYTKIYSLSHQQMHEDLFTIPELKVLGIIDKQVMKENEIRNNSEDIAMKILTVFDKVMAHRN